MHYYFTDEKELIILVYMDDLMFIVDDTTTISCIRKVLQEHFEMIDLGYARHHLGVKFQFYDTWIFVYQCTYIQ